MVYQMFTLSHPLCATLFLSLFLLATWRFIMPFSCLISVFSAPLRFNLCISLLTFDFRLSTTYAATTAATSLNCTAVVCSRQSAARAPFQRHAPSHLPPQNVNSALTRELPASQFGGSICKLCKNGEICEDCESKTAGFHPPFQCQF